MPRNMESGPATRVAEQGNNPVPAETDEDQALFDALDQEVFGAQPETTNNTLEQGPQQPTDTSTTLGNMVRSAADRVDALINKGSEKYRDTKDIVKKIGARTVQVAATTSLVVFELSVISGEVAGDSVAVVKQKVITVARKARLRYEERAQARKVRKQEKAFASYDSNVQYSQDKEAQDAAYDTYAGNVDFSEKKAAQDAAYDTYADNIAFSQAKVEQDAAYDTYAGNIDFSEKIDKQDAAYETYSDNILASENLQQQQEAEQARHEAALRAEAARQARAERHARWAARYEGTRNKTSELWGKVKGRVGKIGRSALRTAKRGGKAVAAATSAARASWQETA
jgi:hypothetical protein